MVNATNIFYENSFNLWINLFFMFCSNVLIFSITLLFSIEKECILDVRQMKDKDSCWMLVPFVFLILVPGIGWGNEFLSRRNTHDGTYSSLNLDQSLDVDLDREGTQALKTSDCLEEVYNLSTRL